MGARRTWLRVLVASALSACASTESAVLDAPLPDAAAVADAPAPSPDASAPDAFMSCAVFGAPGQCITTTACAAEGDHTAYAGACAGPADVQCCIRTPSVADNPPIPVGWKLMKQVDVTADMTTWAVDILHDPVAYPMFSTTTRTFGSLEVLARVEWHPPDFQNGVVHRGVTLYEPI